MESNPFFWRTVSLNRQTIANVRQAAVGNRQTFGRYVNGSDDQMLRFVGKLLLQFANRESKVFCPPKVGLWLSAF